MITFSVYHVQGMLVGGLSMAQKNLISYCTTLCVCVICNYCYLIFGNLWGDDCDMTKFNLQLCSVHVCVYGCCCSFEQANIAPIYPTVIGVNCMSVHITHNWVELGVPTPSS